jgi:hypothetical protein
VPLFYVQASIVITRVKDTTFEVEYIALLAAVWTILDARLHYILLFGRCMCLLDGEILVLS